MKRNVSVVCVCSAPNCSDKKQRSASQPASLFPASLLSLCHLAEGAYTIRLLFVSVSVCVSSHRIVGKCIGILWRSECLMFALIGKQSIKLCQQQFLEKFGGRHPPSKSSIWALLKKLETKGTLLDEHSGGRPKMSEETIQSVKDRLLASPKKSLRREDWCLVWDVPAAHNWSHLLRRNHQNSCVYGNLQHLCKSIGR